jgi:uncharacterized protein
MRRDTEDGPMTANHDADSAPEDGLTLGAVSYLQIPALDVMTSATFYEAIFGWRVERPYPSFEAPGLIGQWVTDRRPAIDTGVVAWINVASIDDTLELVRAHGGEVIEPPAPDGPRVLVTIRDPAGNTVGLVQHGPE